MRQARLTTMSLAATCFAMVFAGQAYAADKLPALSGKGCQVQVTGAVTTRWKGDWQAQEDDDQSANVGATSDYWLSDPDLEEVIESFAGPGEDKAKKVLQGMRRNPRFVILLLNCMADEGRLFLRPSPKSTYQDIARKPWSYRITAQQSAVPGQFVASALKVGKDYYRVTQGRLDIKKFNFQGVTGTFSLKAMPLRVADKGQDINLEGAFDFPCTGAGSRCKLK
jgi:hypothetical protein